MHYARLTSNGSPDVVKCPPNGSGIAFLREAAKATHNDCIVWPYAISKNGYCEAYLNGKRLRGHRIVCELAHGPKPEDKQMVAHWCGNHSCLNPNHLRWATFKENSDDNRRLGVKMGRKPYGHSAAKSRL
jgi:hypothetical protein